MERGENNQHHRWALSPPLHVDPNHLLAPNLYCYLQSLDTPRVTQVRSTDCIYHHLIYFVFCHVHFLCSKNATLDICRMPAIYGATTGKAGLAWSLIYTRRSVRYAGPRGKRKLAMEVEAGGYLMALSTRRALSSRLWGWRGARRSVKLHMYAEMCHMSKSLVLHERWKRAPDGPFFLFVSGRRWS
ncbi:hypothetical protein LX36DRAFT_229850 [Colletotrichum falcatum]|nr:hypothetical protein LX36DRAFT_229850 [Colletotrichum falcatum]